MVVRGLGRAFLCLSVCLSVCTLVLWSVRGLGSAVRTKVYVVGLLPFVCRRAPEPAAFSIVSGGAAAWSPCCS